MDTKTLLLFQFCLIFFVQANAQIDDSKLPVISEINVLLSQSSKHIENTEFDDAIIALDKAIQLAEGNDIDSLQGKALFKLGQLHRTINDYRKADSLFTLSIPLLEDNNQLLADIYLARGEMLLKMGDFDTMLQHLEKAKSYFGKDTTGINMMYYLSAYVAYYAHTSQYLKCIDYASKAAELNKIHKDTSLMLTNKYNLTLIYNDLQAYENSIRLNEEIIHIARNTKDLDSELYSFFSLMWIYTEQKKYEAVKATGRRAIAFKERTKLSDNFGFVYFKMGEAFLHQNQLDSAEHYFNLGIDISEKQNEQVILSSNYGGMSLLQLKKGNHRLAKQFAEKFRHNPMPEITKEVNKVLSAIYEKEGNYQKAYELAQENLNVYEEEEAQNKYEIIAALLNDRFEQEKKAEQEKLNLKIEKQQVQLYFSLALGGIAVLTMLGLIWAYRLIKRRNELLKKDLENKKIIEAQAEELQKVDVLKSRLFTNIAHELRTPLSLISGPVKQLMNRPSLSNADRQTLRGVLANSEQLLTMSTQIQELSKGEIVQTKFDYNRVSLHNFLRYMHSKFQLLADAKGIKLAFPDSRLPDVELVVDAKKLETVVGNLLSNALKYTETDGLVDLYVKSSGEKVELVVHDTGRGIAEEDLPHVFDRYYQAKSGKIVPEGGIGIGLSICKEYAELVGGNIRVESELGKGSSFVFEFPKQLKAVQESNGIETLQFIPVPKINKLVAEPQPNVVEAEGYILIVEDNLEFCEYLKNILDSDYDLVFMHNGKEALRQIERKEPELIITDLMMPIMGGMELIEAIKKNAPWSAIPILTLTANTNILNEIKALRIGVDDYLTKPFDETELKTIVYNLLNFAEEQKLEKELTRDFLLDSDLYNSGHLNSMVNENDKAWLIQAEEVIGNMATDLELNVAKIAETLSITPTHLNRKIKLMTGLTTKKYINEIRLLLARRMIEDKEHSSVKAVAYSVGFKSEKVFSRNFKARFGKSPNEYILRN